MFGAIVAALQGARLPSPPTALAEWRFAEGTGSTVADSASGTYPINLALPTAPNATWTARGLSLAAGLVQTPSIPSARTVAMLYRTGRGQTAGWLLSGGFSAGSGIKQESIQRSSYAHWIAANGRSVAPLLKRGPATSGSDCRMLNRGGWALVFVEFDTAYTTALGLGGRHSTTTERCADFEVAWCAVYGGQLTDGERSAIYRSVRAIAKARGVYIHRDDCPSQAAAVMLNGQSNASGRAPIADLTSTEAARTYSRTYIMSGSRGTRPAPPAALFALGTNQTAESPTTQWGPETPIAWAHEAGGSGDLYIVKTTNGQTYLTPSSVGSPVTASNTWHPDEDIQYSLAHDVVCDYISVVQAAASAGVGLDLRAWLYMQGEQDTLNTVYSATYQTNLAALYARMVTQTGVMGLRAVIGRIRDVNPVSVPTAAAEVRAAQAAFVAATPGAVLIDTDGYPLLADQVHYNAAGVRSLGASMYAAAFT